MKKEMIKKIRKECNISKELSSLLIKICKDENIKEIKKEIVEFYSKDKSLQ